MTGDARYARPPVETNAAGNIRSVGFEIEFGGLSARDAASSLAAAFEGELRSEDPRAWTVTGTPAGDLVVKLDTRFGHENLAEADGIAEAARVAAGAAYAAAASPIIPAEVVTAPIPIDRLCSLEDVVDVLGRAGARGARTGAIRPMALHVNPEAPRLDADAVTAALQAFVLLEPFLWSFTDPALIRSALGYCDPFPPDYARRLVAPGYRPCLHVLIDDYIDANPTRYRDLDALPLLAFLDEGQVRARLPREKIGRRPTFHYRLPDCRIDDANWSPARAWNAWVLVERLAANDALLDESRRAFLAHDGRSWPRFSHRLAHALAYD